MLKRLLAPLALALLLAWPAAATTLRIEYFVVGALGIQPTKPIGAGVTTAVTGSPLSPVTAPASQTAMVGYFTAVDGPIYVAVSPAGDVTPDPTSANKMLVCPGRTTIIGVGGAAQISAITAGDVANCGAATISGGTSTVSPGVVDGSGTVSPVTVGTSSAQAVAAQAGRQHLAIQNVSTAAQIGCKPGTGAALNTAGTFMIGPGQILKWRWPDPIPSEAIACIASVSAPATVQVK